MRYLFITTITIIFFAACKPVKKVQTIQTAIDKKDTAQKVMLAKMPVIDSTAIVKDIVGKLVKRKIDFATFNAKIKVDYEGKESNQHFTTYMSMKKDSVILLKMVGLLGVVGYYVEITKDSVIVINRLDKWVQYTTIDYLKETAEIPFNFYNLQDIIIGNPIFINDNIVSYKNSNSQLLVLMVGNLFKHLITLDNTGSQILHSKLDDVDLQRNRTCDITFSNYQTVNDFQFSTYRKISVAEKSQLDIYLDFKDYKFNEPLKYTFDIPKNYKRR